MPKRFLLIILALLLPLVACQKGEQDMLPSGVTYAELESVIDDFVESHKNTMDAMSVSVFNREHVLMEKSYGYADIAGEVVNDSDTVFEWGSTTKTLVWVSAMQLYEQGKLDLNADIRTYLPEGFFTKLAYDEPITMLHLMNHTAGFIDNMDGFFLSEDAEVQELGDALRTREASQSWPPGQRQAYSNYGAALAGYIVEQIAGMPFHEYVHSNIFEPLGMAQTALKPDLSDNAWVNEQRGKLKFYTANMGEMGVCRYQTPLYPAIAATGTITDLRRFAQALLPDAKGASPLFKKAETLTELYTPTYIPYGEERANCHGFWINKNVENNLIFHNGGTMGCSCRLFIDTNSGVGFVSLNQKSEEITNNSEFFMYIFGKK